MITDENIEPIEGSDTEKCFQCSRQLANFDSHYACNQCEVGPLCMGCVLKVHRNCVCFDVGHEIVHFTTTAINWMTDTCNPQINDLLAQRCRLQHAIKEIEDEVGTGQEEGRLVERKLLNEAVKLARLYDEIENTLDSFRLFLNDLFNYVSRQSPLTVSRFNEGKHYFSQLTTSFHRLLIGIQRKDVEKLFQFRTVLRSMNGDTVEGTKLTNGENEKRGRKRSKSRGSVTIASKDIGSQPKVSRRSKSSCDKN